MPYFFTPPVKEVFINPQQHIIYSGGILLVTCVFCAAPHFHPEAVLGWRYHRALDALFHGGYFFVITYLLYRVARRRVNAGVLYSALVVLSVLLEGAQAWVPGRSFSLWDLAANVAGITGATVLQFFRNKSNRLINI